MLSMNTQKRSDQTQHLIRNNSDVLGDCFKFFSLTSNGINKGHARTCFIFVAGIESYLK